MNLRLRSAGVAWLAMLAAAAPCAAAEGMARGRGGIGGQFGGSLFWAEDHFSAGARPRLAFSSHFRYVMNEWLRWQVSPGFTWTGYTGSIPMPVPDGHFPQDVSKNTNLTLLLPVSFQAQVLVHRGKWHYHVGAGPGVYRIWIENRRIVLVDPISQKLHRNLFPGLTAEIGAERFLKSLPSTSVEACVATHWVFARRDDDFPAGYSSGVGVTELRIGANYYFDTSRLKRAPATPSAPLP